MDSSLITMTSSEQLAELREKLREIYRADIEKFIDDCGHIEVKNRKDGEEFIQPFVMWEAQREALRSIMKNRLNVVLKARQLGFSWLVLHRAAHMVGLTPGTLVIGLSRTEEEAKELVRRLDVIFTNMPELIANKDNVPPNWIGPVYKKLGLSIEVMWPNQPSSKFQAFPSSPNSGRSFTANLIILDEWAFQDWAEEIWNAIFPTINSANGGQVIGLSTIKRGSLFEEKFTDPDNGFNKVFVPWYADPSRDQKWYEATKLAMGNNITAEYPATIEEALQVPGGNFFPEVSRKTHVSDERLDIDNNGNFKSKVTRYVSLDYGLDMLAVHWTMVDTMGNSQTYRGVYQPNLTASEAAKLVLSYQNAEEPISIYLAPPDLWNRNRDTGKSTADIFAENGINLVKVSNDLVNGCILLKELLKVDPETGKCKHTFFKGFCQNPTKEAPDVLTCLEKIQKDKNKPTVYAKDPHIYTHSVDGLRYFAVWWVKSPLTEQKKKKSKWPIDLIEDYRRANKEIKALMVKKYGEPIV